MENPGWKITLEVLVLVIQYLGLEEMPFYFYSQLNDQNNYMNLPNLKEVDMPKKELEYLNWQWL